MSLSVDPGNDLVHFLAKVQQPIGQELNRHFPGPIPRLDDSDGTGVTKAMKQAGVGWMISRDDHLKADNSHTHHFTWLPYQMYWITTATLKTVKWNGTESGKHVLTGLMSGCWIFTYKLSHSNSVEPKETVHVAHVGTGDSAEYNKNVKLSWNGFVNLQGTGKPYDIKAFKPSWKKFPTALPPNVLLGVVDTNGDLYVLELKAKDQNNKYKKVRFDKVKSHVGVDEDEITREGKFGKKLLYPDVIPPRRKRKTPFDGKCTIM